MVEKSALKIRVIYAFRHIVPGWHIKATEMDRTFGIYGRKDRGLNKTYEVSENCALLGYYATSGGDFLPTFRDNLSVTSSGIKSTKSNYHYSLRNDKNKTTKNIRAIILSSISLIGIAACTIFTNIN
jgi:hypothetical protein